MRREKKCDEVEEVVWVNEDGKRKEDTMDEVWMINEEMRGLD